jgi:hypothetical protein
MYQGLWNSAMPRCIWIYLFGQTAKNQSIGTLAVT